MYQVYLGMDDATASAIGTERLIAVPDESNDSAGEPAPFLFSLSPSSNAPEGKRGATVFVPVDVTEWFTYHVDESQHDEQDQATLEALWPRLQRALPELDSSVELIDTATPRTWYEATRRKLGMVNGLPQTPETFGSHAFSQETVLENVFMVGDTVFPVPGIMGVSYGALRLANQLTRK